MQHFVPIGEFKLELQSGNAQSGSNSTIFKAVWPWNLTDDLEQGKSEGFDSCDLPSNLKLDSNRQFFRPCDHEIGCMTSKNKRALLLYCIKLFASFQIHWWIQTGFTVQKGSIRVEIGDLLSRVTLKLDGWPWKTIWHFFYATSSFVQHFVPISEFKLELQSGNDQFGSKLTIFFSCVTFKLDRWPWRTIGHLFYATSSFVHHFVAIGEFKLELQSGNAQFGSKSTIFFSCVTLKLDGWPWKNKRAPLLWYIKLCASFQCHR